MRSRWALLRWARVALGLGLLGLLLSRVQLRELTLLARSGDRGALALALGLLFAANPLLQTLRLHVLVSRYTRSLGLSFEVFSVGSFFNLTLPSNVGGDAVKLLYLKRMQAQSWGAPFALLALHRVTGMAVLLLAAAIYAGCDPQRMSAALHAAHLQAHFPPRLAAFGGGLLLLGGLGWLALSAGRRRHIVDGARRFGSDCATALLEIGARATVELLLLTVAFHALRLAAFYLLVGATGQHVAPLDLLIVLAVTALAGVVPLSVGGLGLMEGAVSITLGMFGVGASAALFAALANRAVLLVGAAIGGVLYITSRERVARGPSARAGKEERPR